MESIIDYINGLGWDFWYLLKAGGILLAGIIIFSLLGRFVFGKKSTLSVAVSSAIGILFIYTATVILRSAGAEYQGFVAPLPFVTITGDSMSLFSFKGADYTVICSQVLSMIILAFLVNLVDNWLPRGKNMISWLFFRCLTVAIALLLHLVVCELFSRYLPEGIVTYAPTILLALLIIMLLTGALKLLVRVVLTTVNPLIAALYTFFFANLVGKQITRAVITTALLALLITALQYIGITVISIAAAALMAYIPFLIILVIIWYIVCKTL